MRFDERSMRDLSIDTSHKQFDFGRRVVYDRNSPNRFHHIVMPSSSQTVHKAESFKRKFLTSPSQSPYPSKYARIDHHRPYARANSANSKTSAFCPEVIDLSQDASEGTEYQIAMKLKEEIRGPRAENGSVRVSQGSSRIVDRCGKVRAIGIVDENSQWGQQQCSVPPSTRGLGIPAAPNWSGYLSDTNEEYYTGGSYNSYGSTDVEHKKALLNSHPVRHNQGPGKQTCSPDHPTQPSSTGRYPSVTLQTPEGPQYRRVNIVNRKVERGKPNVVRIPIQSRDAKAPRSILKKMGPFIAEESTDDEEYYTAAYKFPGHQPIQPATQTVGHGEQDSSIATEKFNTGLLDQSGAATSRALRCQARLQRGNCYVTSLKDTKNPSQQTQEEESSVHNNIQILSGAYIRSNKSIPQAKNPRSPLIPNAIVPGGAFVSNVAPGTLEGPAPVHNPSELDSLVDSDSYYAIHSQLTNYEGSQRKCNDAKNAFKTKTINLQLMNRKMKAVKERAQAKNRAESRTIVFQRSTTSPRAISEDPFRPSAEKDLRNGTIAEAVVQLDPSSSITNLDDCSNASNSGRQCAHVPDPMKTSEDVEKGKPKQNPSKYITSFERNTRRISNSTISFSSAHGENLTLIRSGFNEPKFTGQTHKQQKIATRNIGQEYLQGALQHNQSTQDKQGNKWMSQERASIPSKLSGNFEKETQKSIRDGQQTLADGSCDIHQIHDKESPSLLKASQTLYEGLKNTCGPSRKRFESDTMASAKRKTPDPPISVNNMLENVNSISTETIRMERDNVGSLAQTQARHPSTVSDAEDHQGVPKHGEFREDFAQTAKESKGRTGIEGRIVRFRGRLRMGEITDALEQAQPSEQRLRDLESGQQQVVQKRDSEEQKNQEKAELYSGEKKQVSIDIPKRTKHASQQIRDMHRRNAQRRLNTNSETATKPGKPITITLTPANPLGASPTKSRVPPKNSKARKFSDRSVSRDGLIRKSEIASIHGRGCKPLKNNPAKPVVASIHEVRNKPESLSETSIKETEPQSITTQEFTPMKNVDPALPEANVEIPSISTAGRTTQEMTMEATARPSVPTDETLAKISEEDRLIVEWRDRSMKWQEVEELWNKRMGKTLTESGLRKRYRKAKYILGEVAMSSPTSSPEPPGFPKFLSEAENAPQLRELVNNPSQTKGIRKVLVDYSEDSDLDGSDGAVSEKQQVKPRKNAVAIDQPTCASSARMIQERVPAPISRPASLSVSVPNPEAIPQETTLARPITGGKTYRIPKQSLTLRMSKRIPLSYQMIAAIGSTR
ncbi:hypothetical protein AOQ84DRAFT_63884 [Glonium stellatum]|uniref:Uncharacterized protein n=1 Tax=Glonium stellatum TaxID=574774 RepID=A0A8E2EYS1_9PEZI|nr:hypothetical protein AOQ84DRAFT_63884 [Glonium stellatum]